MMNQSLETISDYTKSLVPGSLLISGRDLFKEEVDNFKLKNTSPPTWGYIENIANTFLDLASTVAAYSTAYMIAKDAFVNEDANLSMFGLGLFTLVSAGSLIARGSYSHYLNKQRRNLNEENNSLEALTSN